LGAVKIDVNQGERDWDNVNESTIESIKGLLKNRYKFDPNYNEDESSIKDIDNGELNINYQAIHTYVTLDKHIEKALLNNNQVEIISLYQKGMTELDIADYLGKSQNGVHKIIKTVCKKIHNEAFEEWKSYINLDVIKTKYNYKHCVSCEEWKPLDYQYFRTRLDKKGDGFYNYCRKCEK
jgi:DNA-binding CsgD family transcriptional regulator